MLEECLLALASLSHLDKTVNFRSLCFETFVSLFCVFAHYILFVSSLTAANKSSAIMSTHIVACLLLYRHRQVSLSCLLYDLLSWCVTTAPSSLFSYFFHPSVSQISTPHFVSFFSCSSTSCPSCPLPYTKVIQMSHTSAW